MGSDILEIGVFKPDSPDTKGNMLLRIWDRETLLHSIPWLKQQNFEGRNIYIRPAGEHNLNLVDDLTSAQLATMKRTGFKPAVIVQTSPHNYQAWVKHPEVLPREVSTVCARALAVKFSGDKGSADWRHFGRLAGFTNRKVKYQNVETGLFPFVRLMESSGEQYKQGAIFVADAKAYVEREEQRRTAMRARFQDHTVSPVQAKTIEQFRNDPRYNGDGSRADLAYSLYALSHGVSQAEVSAAIRSRDLSHKGNDKRQSEYVDRTIKKAAEIGMER
jgi:hypothetical protein